jgi:hypothetical protein
MTCERCRDQNAQTQEYNLVKPNSIKRVEYCDSCAQTVRDGPYDLDGGLVPEAAPSEPAPEATTEEKPKPQTKTSRSKK